MIRFMKEKMVRKQTDAVRGQTKTGRRQTVERTAALLVSFTLLTGMLGGCGNKKDPSGDIMEQEKGRYVETEISFPEEWADRQVRQILRVEEKVHLLLAGNEEGQEVLQEWELQEDGSFKEVTREWLSSIRFPYSDWGELKLMQDTAGVQYLYACFNEGEDEPYKGHLWRGESGTADEITPEKWKNFIEDYAFCEYAMDVGVLENGIITGFSVMRNLDSFLAEDGTLVGSEEPDSYYMEKICTSGNKIYMLSTDMTGSIQGIEIRDYSDASNKGNVETIPFSQEMTGSVFLDVLPDGTMIIGDTDGFFRCEEGDTNWKKLMEGTDAAMALPGYWCKGLSALSDGSFYALLGSDDGNRLMQYRYDPDAVIPVTETLTMYTVMESYLLQQAAVLYHKKHPEVLIRIESAYSVMDKYSGNLDYQQVYQDLNTRLMAGEGADILVLDHLNADTYASKGLLVDIDDVIAPMEEDGSLLSNITGAFRNEDGSRYTVPLQFSMRLAFGRDISENDMTSLKGLADALSKTQENYMGEQTVEELVDKFYPYFAGEMVKDKKLDREVLARNLEYLKAIADNCGIVESHKDNGRGYNMWDIASKVKLAFYDTTGFNGAMFPISIINLTNGTFSGFEESFHPIGQMGLYSKSEHLDTAKDFLKFVLSEEVQDRDYYEGFSVNTASLDKIAAADRSDAEAYTTIASESGIENELHIKDFSQEEAEKLKAMCKSVHVIEKEDDKIREELIAALPGYLAGSQTLEETMDQIEGGLKMYLAE